MRDAAKHTVKQSWRTSAGTLRVHGDERWHGVAAQVALDTCERAHHTGGPKVLGGARVYFKGTRLIGRAAVRHGLRRWCLGRPLPFEREARNLAWLRAHAFGAPLPLASGGIWRGLLPRYQFLVTEEVRGARSLADLRTRGDDCTELWSALGAEVRRLHDAGYVHRDLFPRNVLVDAAGSFVFLDTRRGGRALPGRGRGYDLACLTSELTPALATRVRASYDAH